MPVRHARSETRGRPPFGRGAELGRVAIAYPAIQNAFDCRLRVFRVFRVFRGFSWLSWLFVAFVLFVVGFSSPRTLRTLR